MKIWHALARDECGRLIEGRPGSECEGMNVVICGAGSVGQHAAEVLGAHGHNVTIIDRQASRLAALEETLDVRILHGNGTHADTQLEAGCAKADLFIAATERDEINLLAASIASGLGIGRTIARVQHSAYFENRGIDYSTHLGIDHLVCPDFTTAEAIAQTLRNPGALAVERFARGGIEMQQLPVSDSAPVVGKRLMEAKFPSAVRLVSIERQGQAFIPDKDTVVQREDVVTLICEARVSERARKLIHTTSQKRKRVMMMGGTPLGVWLCRQLHSRAFSVRLYEADRGRADELAAKLDWVTVVYSDPTDTSSWDEERLEQADAFVSVSDSDEHNILTAARAKSAGTQRAIAVLQQPTYLHLLTHVGIDKAFSPRVTAVTQIQRLLDTGPVRHLATLVDGIADVYEIRIPTSVKKIVQTPLREVQLPPRTMIAAIQRDDEVRVPGGDDWIAVGDSVVVIAPRDNEKKLKSLFTA